MQTDIPLKRLTALRAADLLPLFGTPDARLMAVETLELPAGATRLDNVLRVRSSLGQEYLHVIEWQGYRDPTVLWRIIGYLAWLGQRTPDVTVMGTLVYLTPECDVGDTLRQMIDSAEIRSWSVPCIRLWQLEAAATLTSGNLGLAVLMPLMSDADSSLVEQAIVRILDEAPLPQQADLLSILGVFAEPLFDKDRFVRLVGKERLMGSDLLAYLMEEKTAEIEAKSFQQGAQQSLQQALEEALAARFPQAPIALIHDIQRVTKPDQLRHLIIAVFQVADLSEFERLLAQAASL